ncbi:MAG TPA: chromosome partition protein MukE [Polyangiaceae bacterium]|nr:chromosome partition protein MukE [Polyangiaceae bacterium]
MNSSRFERLEDAIQHECFPDVDLALRRGRHIDRSDEAWFTFLSDAAEHLDPLYRRFECELVHKSDGYYYLLPTGDKISRRQLSVAEMLVGQALTLLYLDTASLEHGGVVTREQLIGQLAGTLGSDALIKLLNPKRKRYDERVAEETVRSKIAEAVRRLSTLGFVDVVEDSAIRLRPALLRFAEPVRGNAAPEAALTRLLEKGELSYIDADGSEPDPNVEGDDELGPEDPEMSDEEDSPEEERAARDTSSLSDERRPGQHTESHSERVGDSEPALDSERAGDSEPALGSELAVRDPEFPPDRSEAENASLFAEWADIGEEPERPRMLEKPSPDAGLEDAVELEPELGGGFPADDGGTASEPPPLDDLDSAAEGTAPEREPEPEEDAS